jgi:hypothetical protein
MSYLNDSKYIKLKPYTILRNVFATNENVSYYMNGIFDEYKFRGMKKRTETADVIILYALGVKRASTWVIYNIYTCGYIIVPGLLFKK